MKKNYKICLLTLCLSCIVKADAQTIATFYTTLGNFKVVLTDTLTPITVDSFKARVSRKFYDTLLFHRVVHNFVIQGGDPLGTGYGGTGTTIPDEIVPTLKNVKWSLAMANEGTPNTGDCQFYFNLVNNSFLNGKYTVFGNILNNDTTVAYNIGKVPTDANDRPLTEVHMDSIRIDTVPASVSNVTPHFAAIIYPNPNKGIFSIDLSNIPTVVDIVNQTGQIVFNKEARGTIQIDLRDNPSGLYWVHLRNENGTAVSGVVVP
ncbi:MAG: peptidylprolyl isomerase [Flavipsychrobacter sp.]|nr:peptidylprolyl isomerase [Flavipsychrobacter sp.]